MAEHITVLPLGRVAGCVASKDNSMICVASETDKQSKSDTADFFFMLFSTQNNENIWNFKDKIDEALDLKKIMDFSPDNKYFVYSREKDFGILNIEEKKLSNITVVDYEEEEIFVDEDSKEIHGLHRNDEGNWIDKEGNLIDKEGNLIDEYFTCYKLRKNILAPDLLKFIDNENLLILTWGSIKIFNIKTKVLTQVPYQFRLETVYIKNNKTLLLIRKEHNNNEQILEYCSLSVDQLMTYQKKYEKHIAQLYQNENMLNLGYNFTKFDYEMKWIRFPELKEFTSIKSCDDYFVLILRYSNNTLHYLDFRQYYSEGSYAYFEGILKIPITINNNPVRNTVIKLKHDNVVDDQNAIILETFYKEFMFICQWRHKIWGISNRKELFYVDISNTAFYKLAELIRCGLVDEKIQPEQYWNTFLRKWLYDPRLFYPIYEFIQEPENLHFPPDHAPQPDVILANMFLANWFGQPFVMPR